MVLSLSGSPFKKNKILSGMDNLDKNKFFVLDRNKQTRGNQFKLYKPRFESNIKARSFSTRVINDWNALSNEVVTAENINQFKSRLEVFWSTKAFKYDPTGFHG